MKFLIIDIGAGTMDVLYYDSDSNTHYKAVVRSPILYMAERLANIPGNLLITGKEMGGGAVSNVLKERARKNEVIMSCSSAATIHHNTEKVRSLGIEVIDDSEAEKLKDDDNYSNLDIRDVEPKKIKHIIEGMSVPFSFDVVGICAQDHGVPPGMMSHLDYRHNIFKAELDKTPFPHSLLYRDDEIPSTMNRLTSIAESAEMLPADQIYVMDSGMAAILGASLDSSAVGKEHVMVLDIATSHTVGAALDNGEIAGFFEYHTRDISLEKLESLLIQLGDGKLEHSKILEEGGHGAYIRKSFGFKNAEIIVATGPKRSLIENSRLPIVMGAPLGDNMMTGTAGLLEAIMRRT
ncbi:DUF1786 domain-containing protein [Deltaproteobacteria bacterium]|nr:DUF1786 domain-containing protein [Deltaproteobacteria bacterium]